MNETTMENTSKGLMIFRAIIYIAFGVLVFFYPGASIVGLTLFFGILLLVDALALFIDAGVNRNWSSLFIGLLDVVLGLLVLFNPGITAAVLVWLITVWVLIAGIMMFSMGLASEGAGKGLRVIGGVLLTLLGLYLILQPLLFQTLTIVYIMGSVLIVAGLVMFAASFMKGGGKSMSGEMKA